jgi:hypothetical protein
VRCHYDLLPKQLVIQHQECAIKPFYTIVPEYMEDGRARGSGVLEEAYIIEKYSTALLREAGRAPLVTAEVKKPDVRVRVKVRGIDLIAADDIELHPLRGEGHR